MLNTSAIHMRISGRPTVYTSVSGDEHPVRMKIQDADAMVRLAGSMEMSTADAIGFAAASDGPFEQGGVFLQSGTTYRIDAVLEAKSPGLLRLELSRLSGPGVVRHDMSRGLNVLPTELVEVNGRKVRAHVNLQGTLWEDTGLGVPVETVRITLSLRESDAIGIESGSVLRMRDVDHTVYSVQRTGARTVKVAL